MKQWTMLVLKTFNLQKQSNDFINLILETSRNIVTAKGKCIKRYTSRNEKNQRDCVRTVEWVQWHYQPHLLSGMNAENSCVAPSIHPYMYLFFLKLLHTTPNNDNVEKVFCKCIETKEWESRVEKYLLKLSSDASWFYWSSLRCFCTLIELHLWEILFTGYVWKKAHTWLCWQCISEHKPSMVCRPPEPDTNPWTVPRRTLASIINSVGNTTFTIVTPTQLFSSS